MSAYSRDDERSIRVGRLVEDWAQSGLLTGPQRDTVMPQLQVDLRRTNKFLRIVLFVFGIVILQSGLGLLAVTIRAFANTIGAGILCMLAGAACFGLARYLVKHYKLYRFGVEEAAALSAAGLVAGGAALLLAREGPWPIVVGLAVAAAMLAWLYVEFGYVYAAILAMVCAAALPFQFDNGEMVERLLAISVLAAVAAAIRTARYEHGDDYPGDALAVLKAAAWLGIYLLVNLQVSTGITGIERTSWFYWATYAGTWLLPAAALWIALRTRERVLLIAGIVMALGTLVSNKAYLGTPRYEWDPILFGLLLIGVAAGIRRWLASGHGGERHGYTPNRILASDRSHLGTVAIASSVHTEVPVAPATEAPAPAIGSGGESGGAGAGGKF